MSRAVVAIALLVTTLGCARHDQRLQQQTEALTSLSATAKAIADAWLGGHVSGTYTRTALERTYTLIEQERAALASAPQMLMDRRGAELSQTAERLSRTIALLIADVRAADAMRVRQRLTELTAPKAAS